MNLKNCKNFDSSYFRGRNCFEEDGVQIYLVFQPMQKNFLKFSSNKNIGERKSKGFSNEVIKLPNNSLAPSEKFTGETMYVIFSGSCLKQDKVTFSHGKTVNVFVVYDLKSSLTNFRPTLQNCLFGVVKLTKNSDIDKYRYSEYGIGFDTKGTFLHPSGTTGVNVIIFRADLSSSAHANNKTKSVLIFGEGPTQGLEDITFYTGKMYSVNFTTTRKKFCLSLHYNGDNRYLFTNGTEIYKFKAKDSEIVANLFCLGNISEDFSVANMKKLDCMVMFLALVLITGQLQLMI